MVIKTAVKPKGPSLPSKRPFGAFVDTGRELLKGYGYYQKFNLQQYDPQVYVDKYTYKPHKRVAGYLGQTIHKSKTSTRYNQLGKARSRPSGYCYNNGPKQDNSKGCYRTK